MSKTLNQLQSVARRLIVKYRDADADARTPLLRSLAEILVEAREQFLRPDGSPDWAGRTFAYRQWVGECFDPANLDPEERRTMQAAIRYHTGSILRDRLDDEALEEYGLQKGTPREKSAERRSARTAVLNALTARDVRGGSLLAVTAANTVLRHVDPADLHDLNADEARVVESTLADLHRHVARLRKSCPSE